MSDEALMLRLSYWRCPDCFGTGKAVLHSLRVADCPRCDGTGNALVSGEAERHRRRIRELVRDGDD